MVKQEPIDLQKCTVLSSESGITLIGDKGIYLPNGLLLHLPCVQLFLFLDGLIQRQNVQFDSIEF